MDPTVCNFRTEASAAQAMRGSKLEKTGGRRQRGRETKSRPANNTSYRPMRGAIAIAKSNLAQC